MGTIGLKRPKPPKAKWSWIALAALILVAIAPAAVDWWHERRAAQAIPVATPTIPAAAAQQLALPTPSPPRARAGPLIDSALVALAVDDSYAPELVRQTELLIQALPPRLLPLAPGQPSIPAIIREQYGITQDEQPEHYRRIEEAINRLNPQQAALAIRAPGLLIPLLPPRQTAATRRPLDVRIGTRELAQFGNVRLSEATRAETGDTATERTFLRVRMPVAALTTDAMAELLRRPGNAVLSFPLNVVFGESGCGAAYGSYLDATALRNALQGAAHDVTLFIADTGWPDEESWKSSRQYLSEMCSRVRKAFHLDKSIQDLTAKGAFPPPKWSNTPDGAHSQDIQLALRDFVPLDPHVRIVYVPLTRDQNSADVLLELFRLDYLNARFAGLRTPPGGLDPSILDTFVTESDGSANLLLPGVPPDPDQTGHVRIDGGLVSALLRVATLDASTTPPRRPFFLNASWASPDGALRIVWPGRLRAYIVAATGNEGKKDIEDPLILLAGLAREDRRILAVLALDRTGQPACCTSQVDYSKSPIAAAGYYGAIPAGNRCGSSYAAPRLAWTLAARETLTPGAVTDMLAWRRSINDRLERIRGTGPMPAALLFDPTRYVTAKE